MAEEQNDKLNQIRKEQDIVSRVLARDSVTGSISIHACVLTGNIVSEDSSYKQILPKINEILRDYSEEVARLALKYPADPPQLADDDWKKKYAVSCWKKIPEDEIDELLQQGRMLLKHFFPKTKLEELSDERGQDCFTIYANDALLPITDSVLQCTNIIRFGLNPKFIMKTPEEERAHMEEIERMARNANMPVEKIVNLGDGEN